MEAFGIHVSGWQSGTPGRNATLAHPCSWSFVYSCDTLGRVATL
jgi:hypothetical protein